MIVEDLIKILSTLDQQKEVSVFWDGSARGDVCGIVNDESEVVIVGDWGIYRDGDYRAYSEEKIVFPSCEDTL